MSDKLLIPIALFSEDIVAPGELYRLSLALRSELLNHPVDSVVHSYAAPEEGAKGLGPNETQLLVTLGSSVVPALILLISNWLLRQKDHRIHVKIGNAEIDIPPGLSAAEIEKLVKILTKAIKQIEKN